MGQTRRPRYEMPDYVRQALTKWRALEAYNARPPYQRNDYIWWITDAKREQTRLKRLNQMLDELRSGDRYMNMPYQAESRRGRGARRPAQG